MRQAARSTVITCLRVNQLFHDAAGAELYHTVRVCGEHKMQGLLLGAEWEERLGPWPSWATPEPIEGFKNRLLTRIRVLSVGGRAPGSCGMDWHPASTMR